VQFFFRTANVTGRITLPEKNPVAMPGDNITMEVELMAPLPLHEGMKFSFREGGKTIGHGVVSKILTDEATPGKKGDKGPPSFFDIVLSSSDHTQLQDTIDETLQETRPLAIRRPLRARPRLRRPRDQPRSESYLQ
jgi:hypothetical protein